MKPNFHKKSKSKVPKLSNFFAAADYQLVSLIEKWAANDAERFVPARNMAIFAHAKKFKITKGEDGKPKRVADGNYGKRWLLKRKSYLRSKGAISGPVTRWRDFEKVVGFFVAKPEDVLCEMTNSNGKKVWVWLGWGKRTPFPQQYEHSAVGTAWPQRGDATANAKQMLSPENVGDRPPHQPPDRPPNRPPHQPPDRPPHQPPDRPPHQPPHCALTRLDSKGTYVQNPEASLSNCQQPQEPEEPNQPNKPPKLSSQPRAQGVQEEIKTNTNGASGSQLSGLAPRPLTVTNPAAKAAPADKGSPPMASEDVSAPAPITIGQRFAHYDDEELLEQISDDEIDTQKLRVQGAATGYDRDGNIELLAKATRNVLGGLDAMPWDGRRETCARVMDKVIKFMVRNEQEYPPGFLLVLKELQRTPGPCRLTYVPAPPKDKPLSGPDELAALRARGGFVPQPNVWRKANGFELCADNIWRGPVDREDKGYTVKAADGVWEQPANTAQEG